MAAQSSDRSTSWTTESRLDDVSFSVQLAEPFVAERIPADWLVTDGVVAAWVVADTATGISAASRVCGAALSAIGTENSSGRAGVDSAVSAARSKRRLSSAKRSAAAVLPRL